METVKGKARLTKDGFYVDDFILTFEELEKYDPGADPEDYEDADIEIIGKIIEKEVSDRSPSGEAIQSRQGRIRYFCDIKSIRKI